MIDHIYYTNYLNCKNEVYHYLNHNNQYWDGNSYHFFALEIVVQSYIDIIPYMYRIFLEYK